MKHAWCDPCARPPRLSDVFEFSGEGFLALADLLQMQRWALECADIELLGKGWSELYESIQRVAEHLRCELDAETETGGVS